MSNEELILERLVRLRGMEFVGEAGFERLCRLFNVKDFGIYENQNCPNCRGFEFDEMHEFSKSGLTQSGGSAGEDEAQEIARELHHDMYRRKEFHHLNTLACWYAACEILSAPPVHATPKQIIEALLKAGFRMRFDVSFDDARIEDVIFMPPLGNSD